MATRYWPNPAHKLETTEAGPPAWNPSKERCPKMTIAERQGLLDVAVPLHEDDVASRRYTLRRGPAGLEFYDVKWTREIDGVQEFHGHPASWVPARVLRCFRDRGDINEAEYQRLRKELGK